VTESIEDWAHMQYKGDEKLVKVKGVSPNFIEHHRMDSMIVDGDFVLNKDNRSYAIIGRGIQAQLMISIYDELGYITLTYPVKKDSSSSGTQVSHYRNNQKIIKPGAVFAIEKQYDDNYIFVPLSFAEELMNYGNKRTSLEIKTKNGYSINKIRDKIKEILGKDFLVQNSDEQHSSLLKAIKIEKLFVYVTFSFILLIASLNIFFSLTMLAIDKKKDVSILFSMGASQKFIKNLFLLEGFIISSIGALSGLALGILICWVQKTFGIVSMGMETSIVDAYPVEMQVWDFIFTGITILVITFIISYRPAVKASKFVLRENIK
jgi:lipoprotein-releasing system permease protein